MNVKRFFARTSREAMAQIRAELGEDAVVLKTRKVNNGVEIMAMADGAEIDEGQALAVAPMRAGAARPSAAATAAATAAAAASRPAARVRPPFEERVAANRESPAAVASARLRRSVEGAATAEPDDAVHAPAAQGRAPGRSMSTLTFQQFVRDRLALRKGDARADAREHEHEHEPHLAVPDETAFGPSDDEADAGLLVHPAPAPTRHAVRVGDRADIVAVRQELLAAQASTAPAAMPAMQAVPMAAAQPVPMIDPAVAMAAAAGPSAVPAAPMVTPMPVGMAVPAPMATSAPSASSVPPAPMMPAMPASPVMPAGFAAPAAPVVPAAPAMPTAASMLMAESSAAVPVVSVPVAGASLASDPTVPSLVDMLRPSTPAPGADVLSQLREMRGLISSQLSSLAMHSDLQRDPVRTQLLRSLLGYGFSPLLVRKLIARMPSDYGETQAREWAGSSLARLVRGVEPGQTLLDKGGIYAMTGPTGVGKTTTTAKIAAQFALRHGVGSIGLLTVDAYRIGAQDQLRTFGRLLGVPVHVVHDATGLAEFMNIFMNKKLVLIDTVGVGQRDERVSELLASLASASINRLLVLNAAAQVETLDDVVGAYRADARTGVIVSKLDEAVKLGGVVDCLIRHRLPLVGMADGQRVPEDWHFPDPAELVRRAMTLPANPIFDLDDNEMTLLLDAATVRSSPADTSGARRV